MQTSDNMAMVIYEDLGDSSTHFDPKPLDRDEESMNWERNLEEGHILEMRGQL